MYCKAEKGDIDEMCNPDCIYGPKSINAD